MSAALQLTAVALGMAVCLTPLPPPVPRNSMKILDDWKVYGGVSDLKQPMEGIPVSQVIINSNYSDDHDDYDIALMKLSRPLTLSGGRTGWVGGVLGAVGPHGASSEGSTSCSPRSALAAGRVTVLLFCWWVTHPSLLWFSSSSDSPSLPPHARPAVPDRQVLLHHRLWEDQGERR